MLAVYRPILSLSLLVLLLGLVSFDAAAGGDITAPEAQAAVSAQRLTLIDVRTPAEWRQTGVAPGALRIDMQQPNGPQGFLNAVLAAVNGNKETPIGLICRTGNRSGVMQRLLQQAGFTDVVNVSEGMAGSRAGPGWLKRGLPVDACKQC